MKLSKPRTAFTITELLATILLISIGFSLAIPALGKSRGDSMLQESMSNLVTLSVAHVMYAADFNGRQVTYTVDDLAVYGNMSNYNDAHGCIETWDPGCIPPIIAGWGETGGGWPSVYAYWPNFSTHYWSVLPIGFPDGQGVDGFGNFRLGNAKRLHDYVNGRFFDPTFYAPKDTVLLAQVEGAFDDPYEFDTDLNPPIWISYVSSPAAMYHPDVMRSNAAGGWQDPWSIDNGFESPGLFQAMYPNLKTQILEHNWLQNPPAECNPSCPCGGFDDGKCTPYFFNHGIDSSPAALFYDGHVRLLPNAEVYAADQQVLKDTGGVDGLWHRGTPFGIDGYFIPYGYDDVPLSHHILTTDGIMGRDTLADMGQLNGENAYANRLRWRKSKSRTVRDGSIVTNGGDMPDKPIWSFGFLPEPQ